MMVAERGGPIYDIWTPSWTRMILTMNWRVYIMFLSLELLASVMIGDANTLEEQRSVVSSLLNGYKPDLRPVNHTSDILNVSIGFVLQNLVELHSAHQILSIRGVFVITWTDVSLVWSPGDYGGVRNITVRQKNIWIPDIVLEDSMLPSNALGHSDLKLTVDHTGTVVWRPSDIYHLACSIDITHFPFDTQRCPIVLITWVSNVYEVALSHDEVTTAFEPMHRNGLWDLNGHEVSEIKTKSDNPVIRIVLDIKRQPAYYIVNILFPVFLLSAVNMLVFLLPEECGEKIGLNITVLLAFVVFLTILGNNLPVTSRQTSYLTIYITLLLTISCLSLVSTALVLALHVRSESTDIPEVVKVIVRFLSCRRQDRLYKIAASKMALECSANKTDSVELMEGDVRASFSGHPSRNTTVCWRDVAISMDRMFFVLFAMINATAAFVVFFTFNSR